MKLLFTILLLSAVLKGCEESTNSNDLPLCLKDHIKSLNDNSICDDPSVDEYIFQNETVYVSNPGTCGADLSAAVIDRNCNSLGSLGGISGNTEINGEDFSNATFKRRIWEK